MKSLAGLTIIFSAVGAVLILFAVDFVFSWLEQQLNRQLQSKQMMEEVKKENIKKQKDKPKFAA